MKENLPLLNLMISFWKVNGRMSQGLKEQLGEQFPEDFYLQFGSEKENGSKRKKTPS